MSEPNSRTRTPAPTLRQELEEKNPLRKGANGSSAVFRSPSYSLDGHANEAHASGTSRRRTPLSSITIGSGILRDIRARAPFYVSDWKDAWNYRVIPAIILIFFAKYVLFFPISYATSIKGERPRLLVDALDTLGLPSWHHVSTCASMMTSKIALQSVTMAPNQTYTALLL